MNIVKQIPNSITCLNLISGVIAIIFSFNEQFDYAVLAIIVAALFDFMDGLAARMFKAYSDMGKELDSLADTVSFGVAPSLIGFNYLNGFPDIPTYSSYIILVMAALSAVRLAKFNLDTRQSENFLGLPVPANGLFFSSLITLAYHYPQVANSIVHSGYIIPLLAIFLGLLLVSEIPMFSMKLKSLKWRENRIRYTFLIIIIPVSVAIYLLGIHWTGIISFIFGSYIIANIAIALFRKFSDKKI
ncbi:MAG: CDP-diacylglycerol--serine O-phosphatidyltransferase [Bacteroidales bacterium]|nr:CDP-diacylglycerol--serine O-phosphatidyltransferase [Bacteroidales bacterium]